jgi:uncharacterized surface protein with fasciclin (FAS1) repeats
MKFFLLSIFALASVTAFPYDKTVIENLEAEVPDFSDALKAANAALATTLGQTSACPCNVFNAYGLDQIPVFTQDFIDCSGAGNTTAVDKCIVDNMCTPFKTLAENPCGGFFNDTLTVNYPTKAQLVTSLLTECEKLMGAPIKINDECKANQVEDYTVFALNANPGPELVQYHVVKGAYTVSNLFQKNFVQSVYEDSKKRPQYVEVVVVGSGNSTTVRVVTDFVAQTYANVTGSFAGSNGFLHIIENPMSLPKSPSQVVTELAALSNLTAAVVSQNLAAALDDMDVLTLLAPVNDGFANFPFFANLSNALQVETLQSHIITSPVPVFSTDVIQANGAVINTTAGLELRIEVDGDRVGFVSPEDSSDLTFVVLADVVTSNGVIHIVDAVLRPLMNTVDNNVVDNLFLDERLSSLASLIADSAPQFFEQLRTAENITVFAPQNLTSASMLGISEVEALLEYHTLDTEILSSQLKMGQNVATTALQDQVPNSEGKSEWVRLDGAPQNLFVMVSNNSGNVSVQLQSNYPSNNVDVVVPNVESANNVVIHIVSSPAQVPVDTVQTLRAGGFGFLADSFGNNTELAKMVNGYRPNEYNNDTSKFTIFAARDSAYSRLSANANTTEVSVMQDQLLLGRSLSGEIADLLAQLNGSMVVQMVSGRNITVKLKGEHIYVDGWKVIETDVLTANGVIHVLEGAVGASPAKTTDGLSAGVLAAIIVGGVAFLGLLCYCFFMKGEDGTAEETQPFARIP